jgi:hypothetical protein
MEAHQEFNVWPCVANLYHTTHDVLFFIPAVECHPDACMIRKHQHADVLHHMLTAPTIHLKRAGRAQAQTDA